MSLNDLVHSNVSSDGAGLKQVGFGVMMLLGYHTKFAERSREYAELSEMVTDGFETWNPLYLMAQRAFMQEPRPDKVRVGRTALPYTQVIHWTPTVLTAGYVHKLTLECRATGPQTATVTNVTTTIDSVKEIVEAMKIAIEALNDFDALVTVTEDDTKCVLTMPAGTLLHVSSWTEKLEDKTTDPGIATDITAVQLENDDWYGLVLDINSNLISKEAADWTETEDKIFGSQTSDWTADQAGETTDIGFILQGVDYARSFTCYSDGNTGSYMAVGLMAERFPHDPGSPPGAGGTWMGKKIKGAVATNLSSARKSALRAKNYIVYIITATRSHTLDGKSASGEYIDVTRFLDWVKVRIQESLAQLKLDAERVPYTDPGISQEQARVSAIMDQGVQAGGFSANPYPTVTVPKVADVPTIDKQTRTLNNVKWAATLAGAIHLSNVDGTASV